jgi:hypothetical protein
MVAEGGAGGLDGGGVFGLVKWFLSWRHIFLGDDVVDGLFHLLLFFIYESRNATDRKTTRPLSKRYAALPARPCPPQLLQYPVAVQEEVASAFNVAD